LGARTAARILECTLIEAVTDGRPREESMLTAVVRELRGNQAEVEAAA